VSERVAAEIELKPAQKRALDALVDGTYGELTRGAYERLTGMSRSQAAYDLADLVEAGVFERIGSGRATRYRLPGRNGGPAARRWTDELIRDELERFCAGRSDWPTASEFKAAGHWDLYVAASRYGGVKFWISELGFPRTHAAPRSRRFRSVSLATVGAVAGAVTVAGVAVLLWPSARPHLLSTPDPKIIVEQQVRQPAHPARHSAHVARPKKRSAATPAQRPARIVVSSVQRTPATQAVATSSTPPPASPPPPAAAVSQVQRTSPPPPPAPAGPVPLPAPSGGTGTPSPLHAPRRR
jgi:hypothetical protein